MLGGDVRTRQTAALTVTLVLIAAVGLVVVLRRWEGHTVLGRQTCTVRITAANAPDGAARTLRLTTEQMANAATIAAIGMQRKLPERAVVIALATAFQESKLRNLSGGDRDSVGLFQQRPSQGWGTVEQIRDIRYASNAFYAALEKVRGWETMRVTEAAQAVQRSAFPELYEQWADESEVLARALLGHAGGAVTCAVAGKPAMRGSAAAEALVTGLHLDWGTLDAATPADPPGVTVAVADTRSGWRYAHWLVAHASAHGVKRVRFGAREWTARSGTWTQVADGATAREVIAEVFS